MHNLISYLLQTYAWTEVWNYMQDIPENKPSLIVSIKPINSRNIAIKTECWNIYIPLIVTIACKIG